MLNKQYEINTLQITGRYLKYFYYFIRGIKVIHCLGDSHVGVFNYYRENKVFRKTAFKVYAVSGATAIGINNIRSTTRARCYFDKYIKHVKKDHTLLFCLGEVDCDFVLWLRGKRQKTDIEKQLLDAVRRYGEFIDVVRKLGHKNIIIYSVPLPTIRKDQMKGFVAALRKNADINIRKRTDLSVRFNCLMRQYCIKEDVIFLDLEKFILNKKTKVIDTRFINPDKLDHHLYGKKVIPCITKELQKYDYN